MNYHLRFPDEATAMEAFRAAGLIYTDEDGIDHPSTASHAFAMDVIGAIYTGGTYDNEGEVIEPPTLLPGWHVNYIGELPAGWDAYLVNPAQPVRVWA